MWINYYTDCQLFKKIKTDIITPIYQFKSTLAYVEIQKKQNHIKNTTNGLEVNSHGGIIVTEDGLTSRSGVYAGGDAVTGAATVISAMGAGKTAAKAIYKYLINGEEV